MSEAVHSGTPDPSVPATPHSPSAPTNTDRGTSLSGRMGASSLMLTVLAFSAPISVVSGFIPFTIYFGGVAATFAFVVVTVLLLVFAVGYVTMTKHVPKPGDFYSFISTGLGRIPGLGAAFMAATSYLVMQAGVYAFFGISVQALITSFGGADTHWLIWALAAWVAVTTLGYFHIELSARILVVIMVLEVLVVMIYNAAVLVRGGDGGTSGLQARPLDPATFMKGDVGVTLLFGVLVFLGFEATALFRDEVREPNRTIPRATFGAVLFVGALYTLSCYCLTVAYGSKAVETATNSPSTMFSDSIGHYVGSGFTQISQLFVCSSIFAALISIHNVLARYLHNLGFDNALPSYFAAVHPRHGSPHRSSNLAGVVTLILLLAFVVFGVSGPSLYAELTGLAGVGVIALMSAVSLAAVVWFVRKGVPDGETWLTVYLAPAIACAGLAATVVLALTKFNLVVGGDTPTQNMWLLALPLSGMVIGVMISLYYRYRKPSLYRSLGREDRMFTVAVED